MAVSLLTKLDAVNKMLEGVWEAPVSTLEVSGLAAVAMAKRILDETSVSVQSKGWAFNTEYDFPIMRDSNSNMPVPLNAIRIDTDGIDKDIDVVRRGNLLYDRTNHTYAFPDHASLNVKIVLVLEFEELPQAARYYIACQAARVFHDKYLSVETTSPVTYEEATALDNLQEEEAEVSDCNVFRDSYSVANIIQR